MSKATPGWRFSIDVGGTFTDCVARTPAQELRTLKVLSSARLKGRVAAGAAGLLSDESLCGLCDDFLRGFELSLLGPAGVVLERAAVTGSRSADGAVLTARPLDKLAAARSWELASPEEAPLLCMRMLMGLRLDEGIGEVELRLGTTRGTNALLERKGARTAFLTTPGFADILLIGNQDRPSIFDLEIRKPDPLFEVAVEIPGRISAGGEELEPLDLEFAAERFAVLESEGFEAVSICLLHAAANPRHEEALGELAEGFRFEEVVLSSRSSSAPRLVSRGDTALVDAYLGPVIGSYVGSIADAAPAAKLRLLTSAGALCSVRGYSGKDSVLSGPAGGVVGAADVARQAGSCRAIAFDMGGTSTDVSRWDGSFELEHETVKAGVRIATPLLAIETVAAGGGSICDFDGEKLTVGPHSAGSAPGPACYGAGGPLTVTDMNFFLGRIPSGYFPFPLDEEAVREGLDSLAGRLRSRGYSRSLEEIAEGFLEIADHRMAAAIRKISLARGYDVREYLLVAFGGAGAQHACAVARQLGISRVMVPPLAGILSARGASQATVTKIAEKPVLELLDSITAQQLGELLGELEEKARQEVLEDGIEQQQIEVRSRSLDLRYRGQESSIELETTFERCRDDFEEAHERLYGFTHPQRELELVAARVSCEGLAEAEAAAEEEEPGESAGAPGKTSRVFFAGGWQEARLLEGGLPAEGESLCGPAVAASSYHTLFVEPGWTAARQAGGNILLEQAGSGSSPPASRQATQPDPVQLEIFHQHFASIAEEMGLALERSAVSTNVRERLDFSCAIFDADGGLVANAPHIPVHLGAMGECVRQVSRKLSALSPGDVVVSNDPFLGGSHLPDVTVISPVFEPGGELLFYTANRAHHAEIGGIRPGSMPPDSKNLAEEGVLLRSFKVIDGGLSRFDELGALLRSGPWPSRSPQENIADIEAQVAANKAGAGRLEELIETCGRETVLGYMGHIQDAARRLMESQIQGLDPGPREFKDELDDGTRIALKLERHGRGVRLDFTGTSGVLANNFNATPAIVSSAALYCFRCLVDSDIPLNAGVLEPLEIILPECFLNPAAVPDPAECAAVSAGNVETSQRIVDVIFGALGLVAASQGTMNNLLFGNEDFGYYETIAGGAGAGAGFRGADGVHTHMTNTRITDPEVLERRYPVRLHRFCLRRGSGGAGENRGGEGILRELEFLEQVEVSILSQRRLKGPYGQAGGEAGRPGRNLLSRQGEAGWEELPAVATFSTKAGDRLRIETPGGGGWGKPPG